MGSRYTRSCLGKGQQIIAIKRCPVAPLDRSYEVDGASPVRLASSDEVDLDAGVPGPVRPD